MTRPTNDCLLLLLISISATACTSDAASRWPGARYDSAGITVVANHRSGAWATSSSDPWAVEQELILGVREGTPPLEFGRIVDADSGPDGRIYILDQQAGQIRVFDGDGNHLLSFGQPGEGPGQLSTHKPLGAFAVDVSASGEVFVPDRINDRLNRFDQEGEFLGSVPLGADEHEPIATDLLSGGDYAVHWVSRDSSWNGVVRIDPRSGQVLDTILTFRFRPSPWGVVQRDPQGRTKALMHSPLWSALPDGRFVSSISKQSRFYVWTRDGRLSTIVDLPEDNEPLDADEQEEFIDRMKAIWAKMFRAEGQTEGYIDAQMRRVEEVYIPPTRLPSMTALESGPEQTVWIRTSLPIESMTSHILYPRPPLREFWSPIWQVFGADGTFLGEVGLPEDVIVLGIEDEHIHGVQVDELDVQRFVRLRIVQSAE